MFQAVAIRIARLVATLFVVSLLTFMMTALLPGDPVNAILPPTAPRDQATIDRVRDELGLDDPLPIRYINWAADALRGDLGKSYVTNQTISDTIKDRVPVTAQLAFMAVFIAVIMAVPLGILGAYREGRWQDTSSSAAMQVMLSVPNFVTGIFLIWLFAVKLNWLPSANWSRISDGLVANLKTSILPATALATTQIAIFSRLVRSDMIATLKENYILSARAKGLKDRFILFRHALRPSSLSLVTIIGINFGALLGGTVIIETLFAIPGLGFRLINAISSRDFLAIQGITVFIAFVYVLINALVDILYLVIDPRIRKG